MDAESNSLKQILHRTRSPLFSGSPIHVPFTATIEDIHEECPISKQLSELTHLVGVLAGNTNQAVFPTSRKQMAQLQQLA